MISSLKDLRLVDLGCLILHEAHDEDRLARLRGRIEAEREQRNPVIVSPHEDRYLVLDGAHRIRALGELGSRFALVQTVEPPEKAEGWGHLLDGVGRPELDDIEGIEVSDRPGDAPLAEVETAGETLLLSAKQVGLPGRVRALWDLQAFYPRGVLVRRVEPDGTARLSDGEALIRYHSFTPEELAELVDSGTVLPAGITRFRVRERVLGVRYPLDRMMEGDRSARNAELKEFVEGRWEENRVRYYGEPVVLFE
ncbi:MAG: ParB N-terminal domain-containing protein [Rubrobacteraceae bacterium]|nr:ParB N-terminal domain-containing protein [Rubrobacteraceae bacterium]